MLLYVAAQDAIMNSDVRELPQPKREALAKTIKNLQSKLLGIPIAGSGGDSRDRSDAAADSDTAESSLEAAASVGGQYLYRSSSDHADVEEEESIIDSIIDDLSELGLAPRSDDSSPDTDDSDGYHGSV